MSWSSQQLRQIGACEEIEITSSRSEVGPRSWTPMWVVRVCDDLCVRAVRGAGAHRYQRATVQSSARIWANGIETDVRLDHVVDPAVTAAVTAAYEDKYAGQGWLPGFVTAPATESTLCLGWLDK